MSQSNKLRAIYAAALGNMVLLAAWGAMFEVPGLISQLRASQSMRAEIMPSIEGFLLISFLIVAVPVVVLIRRPTWWGKLLLPAYGSAWLFHVAAAAFIVSVGGTPLHIVGLWVPAACGVAMFGLAIAHQIVDPSFRRGRPTE